MRAAIPKCLTKGEEMGEQTLSDGEILSRFLSGAKQLQGIVENLSEAQLDLSREPNTWSIRQIVHHLADDCDVWSMCIKKAIARRPSAVRGLPGQRTLGGRSGVRQTPDRDFAGTDNGSSAVSW